MKKCNKEQPEKRFSMETVFSAIVSQLTINGDEKNNFNFIYLKKNTDANWLFIFLHICMYKCDFMQSSSSKSCLVPDIQCCGAGAAGSGTFAGAGAIIMIQFSARLRLPTIGWESLNLPRRQF
jgi:hypothetical protein